MSWGNFMGGCTPAGRVVYWFRMEGKLVIGWDFMTAVMVLWLGHPLCSI